MLDTTRHHKAKGSGSPNDTHQCCRAILGILPFEEKQGVARHQAFGLCG